MPQSIHYPEIHTVIAGLLRYGDISISNLAVRLDTSVRTLQRRLLLSGTTFRQLVDEVRCAEACRLLCETDLLVSRVAVLLGYKDPSSLSRAFMRWRNVSPYDYRRNAGKNPSKN